MKINNLKNIIGSSILASDKASTSDSDANPALQGGVKRPNNALPDGMNALDILDIKISDSSLDSVKQVTRLNMQPIRLVLEPMYILGAVAAFQAPTNYQITPGTWKFDPSGNITIGANIGTNVDLIYADVNLGTQRNRMLGNFFMFRPFNRENGQSEVIVTHPSGWSQTYLLTGDVGYAFIWNTRQAFDAKTTLTTAFVGPNFTGTFNHIDAVDTDDYQIDLSSAPDLNIRGTNIVVTSYPVIATIEIYHALLDAIVTDSLDSFGDSIISAYSSHVG